MPLYLGLILAQCVYVFLFGKELLHLITDAASLTEQSIMLVVLGLIDVVMISNLLVMVIIGISSIHLLKTFIEAGALGELPLCSSPAGMAAVQAGIDLGSNLKACSTVTLDGVMWETVIHSIFILSAIGIAWTDRLMSHATRAAPAH